MASKVLALSFGPTARLTLRSRLEAEYAGLPFLRPYLLPGLKSYTEGINFASAGACVLVETRPKTINMKMQVDYFREMVQKMKQEIGEVKAYKVVSKAVYMVNIGGNDYVELVNRNLHKLPLSPSHKNFYMKEVIANLTTHIKTIYNEGGRKFAFQNIGPMGCLPAMKFMLKFKGTCAQEPLSLARMHNAAFLVVLKKFESQLPGFKYTVYDFYSSLYLRVLYGKRYGFTDTLTACCGSGAYNGDFTCQKKGEFRVCKSPSDHLWFDAGHPTEKADQQFAKEFWSGSSNLVSPYNLKALFNLH